MPTRRDQILPALTAGLGDIAAANLTVKAERSTSVAFASSWSDGISEIVVSGPAGPKLASLGDLAGREIRVRRSSSYAAPLDGLAESLGARGLAPPKIMPLDEHIEDEAPS